VPPEIDDIVMTALSRDPDGRWQHATALRTALTTLTRRLGLVSTNRQVVEWIGWALEQTKPHGTVLPAALASGLETDPSGPGVQLEDGTRTEPRVDPRAAASSQKLTLVADGPLAPPTARPTGTPAQSITAQPAVPSGEPRQLDGPEYRAAVAAYERFEGLAQGKRSTDDVQTTLLRPSVPRIAPPAAAPPAPAAAPSRPSDPSVHNVTLLDGAAALRSRSASQSAAPSGPLGPGPLGSIPPQMSGLASIPPQPPARPSIPPQAPSPLAPPVQRPRPASERLEVQLTTSAPGRRSTLVVVVVLVLLAAGLAAAGVYLVLPHLT